MKIINTKIGRVILSFSSDETYPISTLYLPEFVKKISEEYKFVSLPTLGTNLTSLNFYNGFLSLDDNKKINIGSLQIFSDYVLIDTTNTNDSEKVMDSIINWMMSAFSFRKPKTPMKKIYESHIIVDFDKPMDTMLKVFEYMGKNISEAYEATYNHKFPINVSSLKMASDPLHRPSDFPLIFKTEFSIERRNEAPYSYNRFYCIAALPTDKHAELLKGFEKAVLKST